MRHIHLLPKSHVSKGPPLKRLNPSDLPPDIDTFARPTEASKAVEQDPTGRYLRVSHLQKYTNKYTPYI